MSDLPLLLQRVREASGPDRELDLFIWRWEHGFPPFKASFSDNRDPIYAVTASLNAAVALVERVRPGTCILAEITPAKTLINLHAEPVGEVGLWQPLAEASTPPLALLAALLASLTQEAQRE